MDREELDFQKIENSLKHLIYIVTQVVEDDSDDYHKKLHLYGATMILQRDIDEVRKFNDFQILSSQNP